MLQEPLETLMMEARLLRARLELLIAAQQMAIRELRQPRRHRHQNLKRAERYF